MMGFDDFGLSVLASWLANKVDVFTKPTGQSLQQNDQKKIDDANDNPEIKRTRRFKTFDAWNDLGKILKTVRDPLISILIEDEPSTHYRLPSMVLESRATGEWYVFSRGRMSFEGDGGGIRNSRDILDQVRTAGAAVGVWVVPQGKLDDLDNGYQIWSVIRDQAVPLLAVIADKHSWIEIEENVTKYAKP